MGGYKGGGRVRKSNNKFHASKVKVDGMTFDSIREFRRWSWLLNLQERGEIRGLKRQVSYPLIPAQYEETEEVYQRGPRKGEHKRGKCIEHGVTYVADFVYQRGPADAPETVVEDAKGVRTEAYAIKRKMMLWVYGIRIKEV